MALLDSFYVVLSQCSGLSLHEMEIVPLPCVQEKWSELSLDHLLITCSRTSVFKNNGQGTENFIMNRNRLSEKPTE